ncbi:MAG: hypothetical protein WCE56_01800 [Desulfobacterales bacterium]
MAHYFLGMVALVFPRLDSRTAVTDAVLNVPVVTDLKEDVVNLIRIGGRVCVDGDQGVIEILDEQPSGPHTPQVTTLPGIHFDHEQLGLKSCNRMGPIVPILDMTSPE